MSAGGERAALFCPGRGSYTEASLGTLPLDDPDVQHAERLRAEIAAERGVALEPLALLDRAARFEPARHLRPANASVLIWLASWLDARRAAAEYEVVCVGGNSMGWYTALTVAGALDFAAGLRLVQVMALLQEQGADGGQVLYPVVDAEWRADPALSTAIQAALASSAGEAFPSIELGGYRVLAGTPVGVAHLMRALPRVSLGRASYPLRLLLHGPYHTPLARAVAERAQRELASLPFTRPSITLVDGRGVRYGPLSTDPTALAAYSLDTQVREPFDFTATVRVALREWAPERVVLPGPGNTLGGVIGQILAAEGWGGIHSRADFTARQESLEPIVVSMGR